jgi:hypothetical protein
MTAARTRPTTPDLFSHPSDREAASPSENLPSSSLVVAKAVNNLASPRRVLPKNLNKAVGHLSDSELDSLHVATVEEMKRRGRLPRSVSGDPPARQSEQRNKPARLAPLRVSLKLDDAWSGQRSSCGVQSGRYSLADRPPVRNFPSECA